jgi:hypothetical protein
VNDPTLRPDEEDCCTTLDPLNWPRRLIDC